MRKTGKTTRLVDEAIQKLFNEGVVRIPKTTLNNFDRGYDVEFIKSMVSEDNLQHNKHLISVLQRRLSIEHSDLFYNIVYNKNFLEFKKR